MNNQRQTKQQSGDVQLHRKNVRELRTRNDGYRFFGRKGRVRLVDFVGQQLQRNVRRAVTRDPKSTTRKTVVRRKVLIHRDNARPRNRCQNQGERFSSRTFRPSTVRTTVQRLHLLPLGGQRFGNDEKLKNVYFSNVPRI